LQKEKGFIPVQREHNMITFSKGNIKFTYRIAAIIIHQNHVLLQHAVNEGHWFLIGGRAELGETAQETVTREVHEELGIEGNIERLLWVVENFFALDGKQHHELGLYFLVSLADDAYIYDTNQPFVRTDTDAGEELVLRWHSIDKLAEAPLYPAFLQEALKALPEGTEHVVHVDG
jgi:8-oxo-dGTP pyrophosphatase MutT (NUDIX family)